MGINPMQKMKRNSTLTGLVIGLLIGLVLCAFLYMFLTNNGGQVLLSNSGEEMVNAYVLAQDVRSGQIITPNMLMRTTVLKSMVPANYVNDILLSSIQLQDEEGNVLYTTVNGEMYIELQNAIEYKKIENEQNKVIIEQDENGKYFKTKIATGEKEYVKFISVPTVAKINMRANSILTTDAISKSDEITKDDLRKQEYNMISLPTNLAMGDFVDIRLQLPNGGDYIVISKKKVLDCNATTIWLNMYEEEIELLSNAIIEYYIMAGSKLYATTYVEPGLQTASVGTYVPNSAVLALIKDNPNIKTLISSQRYSDALVSIRNSHINAVINQYNDSAIANIEENIKEEIESLKESREAYFGALNSVE